ncbi:MAG: DUF1553 domain-containing protein [Pirellulales bacterium]|nr:DUF1553 domain-containing protein [Pirellulales bacterium]
MRVRVLILLFSLVVAVVSLTRCVSADTHLQYNRDIRPILFDACISCHGRDSAAREADLRLDQREMAVEREVIVPGNPDASELVHRIFHEDASERMPPPETKKQLTDEQKATLERWIREGAEYQPHWSLIPPEKPTQPKVANSWWVKNPIDSFVAAKLEEVGLPPAEEANRRTLARRVSLDLTGLPPTPETVESFVEDKSADAYEKLVDRFIRSPHWGEHRARYWLDLARYADTHGLHFDNYREMWTYRDWVIKAFNQNLPFDQFTIESLAGDLLENATLDQQIASGFNRCNITSNEGGSIEEELLVLYTRDRTETTAVAWLGLTAGCAVCHDHKFDPISQREFYELAAFFNNTTQSGMDGNLKASPPVTAVPLEEDREDWNQLHEQLLPIQHKLDDRRREARNTFEVWLAETTLDDIDRDIPEQDLHFAAALDIQQEQIHYTVAGQSHSAELPTTAEWHEGPLGKKAIHLKQGQVLESPEVGDFEGDQPFSIATWIKLSENARFASLIARMEEGVPKVRGWDVWIENGRIGMHLVHKWPSDAIKVSSSPFLQANKWHHVVMTYDGSRRGKGFKIYVNGIEDELSIGTDTLKSSIRTEVPFKVGQRHNSRLVSDATIADLRIYARELEESEISILGSPELFAVFEQPASQRQQVDTDRLYTWWLKTLDPVFIQLHADQKDLKQKESEIRDRGTVAYVMCERKDPAMAHLLHRGGYSQRREQLSPDTPDVLPDFPDDFPRNRLGLARWLFLPNQPLTARVTVNRCWQELFGTGLVRTAGDFGVSGELPSHPQLLDWLDDEFRESGWNLKHLYKLMVMSATYRQIARTTRAKLAADPGNRMLSRGPRFRMDGEMVRDYALSASGLLVNKIGGPSVKPYQPPGVWEAVAMIESNTRDYQQDEGEALYRRSLYTFWKRAAPPASMETFNAPNREHCVMVRERTNTPLQALVTLNDPQFVEAARHLATHALQRSKPEFQDRIQWLGRRILGRPFRSEEIPVLQDSFAALLVHYQAHFEAAEQLLTVGDSEFDGSLPPDELAAWTMMVNAIMNLDEVLNK